MDQLVFFTNPQSRGRIVRWMLEEIGQPYRTELLEFGTTMKAPAYRTINPMGKAPAIRHGATVVTETAAICAFLAPAVLDAIEGALKGRDYLLGNGFTAADLVLGAQVAFATQMGIFEQRPAFGPYAVGFRTLDGVVGLNDVWRFDMSDGGVARLRLYCFSPDVIAAVAKDLGVPALKRPYRSPG